ncbi:DUF1697 domain-containing protein [Aureibaculum sp. 2210JD6-5]|uniref:DUF1697 domain-containing protein n=1 Tax=Aureibaculum sp. 2210JD6-5 TaxID=3103957 RepID=UPI002AAD04EA|nr:DUF1697 domain-containing protein [Aureibaculum sp. 2210JD6-5]MDY7394546.1 DUF1697 domain-containing protein [Aureibaculum sp. 2210JD6-5]
MTKYIAILRGINVGGHRKILMADLKQLLEKMGLQNVITYIQSGNVIFSSTMSEKDAEKAMKKAVHEKYGFDVPVLVRTVNYFHNLIDNNPYLKDENVDINQLYVTFLSEIPNESAIEKLENTDFNKDKFTVIGDVVFLCFNSKLSDSKLDNNIIEKKLNLTATTRNWKTVLKLIELSGN